MFKNLPIVAALAAAVLLLAAGVAGAEQPEPWQIGFQAAASPVADRIHALNKLLLTVEIGISVLVFLLMGYIAYRFSAKRNPVPSKRTHNSVLEVLWTAVPILILVVIAVPSLRLLYYMDRTHDAQLTLKVTGHQWYWSYEYPDNGDFSFDSILVPKEDLKPGQPRLLTVDNRVVLPVNTNVRILVTSTDVIHSWAVPAFGIKTDAVPGRTNETWVSIERPGTYYGQCSELCGVNHGFMPIEVHAVSKADFQKWVAQAKQKFAAADAPAPKVASRAAPVVR